MATRKTNFENAGTQSDTFAVMEGHNPVPKFDPFGEPSNVTSEMDTLAKRICNVCRRERPHHRQFTRYSNGRSSATPTYGMAAPTGSTVTFSRDRRIGHFPDIDGYGRSPRV